MDLAFSTFGQSLCKGSGIEELMEDLGQAMSSGGSEVCMMGGGQPAHIPAITALWKREMQAIINDDTRLIQTLSNYDPPRGNPAFLKALAELFCTTFGWDISAEHLAITTGGQSAFFFLFNLLAGTCADGQKKHVLLPLLPEYIGYANQSVGEDFFRGIPPKIEKTGRHSFKYHVDFDALHITKDTAAICVSRPTNPTGNVLSDAEVERLSALAKAHGIPLILDNAYGLPFPNIMFTEATPVWEEHLILTFSLSKIGLPGTRTGIVLAHPAITQAIASSNAIVGLANGNVGQAIMTPLVESGEVLEVSKKIIQPYYLQKSQRMLAWIDAIFDDSLPYYVHASQGALFVWMWFENLPISSATLYERLKKRNVLVISGHYFFFGKGAKDCGKHRHECLRITYTMDGETIRKGLSIIAEEVAKAYREG